MKAPAAEQTLPHETPPRHRRPLTFAWRRSLTAHGVQPDQAADVVVEIHVPFLIAVPADDHLKQLVVEREACVGRDKRNILLCPIYLVSLELHE